jgi:hypothetical protein
MSAREIVLDGMKFEGPQDALTMFQDCATSLTGSPYASTSLN